MKNAGGIYLLTLTSFLVGTAQFVITGILDQVALSVGVSIAATGQLITAYALANAIGTPLFMIAAARMNQKNQLLVALVMIVVGLLGTAFVPGFFSLMIFRSLVGIGAGIYSVTSFAIAAKLAPQGRQAGATTNLSMGYSASLIVGVPLGRVVSAAFGWPTIFGAVGVLGAVGLAAAARWIPSTKGQAPVPLGHQLSYLRSFRVLVSLAAAFAMFISYSAVSTYITPVLTLLTPMDNRKMSLLLLAIGVTSVAGSKLGGLFADRLGLAATLIGGMLVQALALVLVLPVSAWDIASLSLLLVWAAAAWECGPILNFNLIKIAPEASGILLSLNSSCIQLGFAAGAGLGGVSVAAGGPTGSVLWVGAAAVGVAAALMALSFQLSQRASTKRLDERGT